MADDKVQSGEIGPARVSKHAIDLARSGNDLGCDECPPLTDELVAACASVGIEHGRTVFEEVRTYMNAKHREHGGTDG